MGAAGNKTVGKACVTRENLGESEGKGMQKARMKEEAEQKRPARQICSRSHFGAI